MYDICSLKHKTICFFIILFENLELQTLSLLSFYQHKYKFLKINKYQKTSKTDFEFNFKLNNFKLNKINNCLLIGINSYKESVSLNLKLKQRHLKGNFKSFSISSLLTLNFINKILGSTIKTLKMVIEGQNLICQNLKTNSLIIFNFELLKRKDNKNILNLLSYLQILKNYSHVNCLNSSIYQTGICSVNNFNFFNPVLLLQFSSIYLINLTNYKTKFINKILQIKLNYCTNINQKLLIKKNIYNQHACTNNFKFNNKKLYKYFNLPTKNFFETKEIFFNTQGLLKHTTEVVLNKKLKSNWKLIRAIFNKLKKTLVKNSNLLISYNNNHTSFINVTSFLLLATNMLKKNNLLFKTNSFFNNKLFLLTKKIVKLINSKIHFWLNDFFIDGKDNFTKNSILMIKCSKNARLHKTNMF